MSRSEKRETTERVNIRLTPAQRATIDAAAAARDMSPGAFVKRSALRAAGLPLPPAARKKKAIDQRILDVQTGLARLGNNVNQLAKVANSKGDKSAVEGWAAVLDQLKRLHIEADDLS